jgi:2-polyprenyl-3-methyl-5-hydroxy-6-metoxy-1,4-benzoquinol methylase
MRCQICNHHIGNETRKVISPLVSSDCQIINNTAVLIECSQCGHIQKICSDDWKKLCKKIYNNYKIYHQGSGKEQKSLNGVTGQFEDRSISIVSLLLSKFKLKDEGTILDVGCGNGAFLKSYNNFMTNWSIVGSDLNENFRNEITSISTGSRFLTIDELSMQAEKFDVVTLVHCLEHIERPVDYLKYLSGFLREDGLLLIQVPDVENNPFDLVIADHAAHFKKNTLKKAIDRSGLNVMYIGNDVSLNEITLMAGRYKGEKYDGKLIEAQCLASNLNFLNSLIKTFNKSAIVKPLGIFGSSISATWVFSQIPDSIDFFVDEDTARIGNYHLNRKIISTEDVAPGASIIFPFSKNLANRLIKKHQDKNWNIIVPEIF